MRQPQRVAILSCLVLASTCIGTPAPVGPGTRPTTRDTEQVRFVAEGPKSAIARQAIIITVRIKNTGKEPLRYLNRRTEFPEENWEPLVERDGKAAPYTPFGKQLHTPQRMEMLSLVPVTLAPGQEARAELDVTSTFDMTDPGTYTVRVRRWVLHRGADDLHIPLISEPLTVKILPRQQKK